MSARAAGAEEEGQAESATGSLLELARKFEAPNRAQAASLLRLDLDSVPPGAQDVHALSTLLHACSSLTHLGLVGQALLNEGLAAVLPALSRLTQLTHLGLRGNGISAAGARPLVAALARHTRLTDLDLSKNHMGEASAGPLAEAISHNPALRQSLKRLNLARNGLGGAGLTRLGLSLQGLDLLQLDLSWNSIDSLEGLSHLTCLTHLNLSENCVDARISDDIFRPLAKLRHLDLSDNRIAQAPDRRHCAHPAAELSATQRDRWGRRIGSYESRRVHGVLWAFAHNTLLEVLSLAGNSLGDSGLGALANLTALQWLCLAENGISCAGATELAHSLSQHTRLRHLDLARNWLGASGLEQLLSTRADYGICTSCLVKLDLGLDALREDGCWEGGLLSGVLQLLDCNPSLRSFPLSKRCVSEILRHEEARLREKLLAFASGLHPRLGERGYAASAPTHWRSKAPCMHGHERVRVPLRACECHFCFYNWARGLDSGSLVQIGVRALDLAPRSVQEVVVR